MGIFDNSLVSGFIPKAFIPSSKISHVGHKYIYEQQSGCGIRIYPNSGSGQTRNLFWEIENCSVDRTTADIGGGFQFTLIGSEPWDEIIQPDDFVRIFMGDQIVRGDAPAAAYNFASGVVDQKKSKAPDGSAVLVPLPNSEFDYKSNRVTYGKTTAESKLLMYERMIGKVDRVQRIESAGSSADSGFQIKYVVSGRSFGSIVQDISLYYNEWIPGLNAINVFYGSTVPILNATPGEIVRELLTIVLSAVPLPQWQIPKSLLEDLNYVDQASNMAAANKALSNFKQRLASAQSTPVQGAAQNAITELEALVKEGASNPSNNPFNVISIKSLGSVERNGQMIANNTFGSSFNLSFLNSQNTGLLDMIKHAANDPFNEFFFDLCPGGNVEGGLTMSQPGVPSFVMRQRPFDITDRMLESCSNHLTDYRNKLSKFPQVKLDGVSSDLFDLDANAITVFGRMLNADVKKAIDDVVNKSGANKLLLSGQTEEFVPTVISNETGYANHDRLNAFLVLGNFNRGQLGQTDRQVLSQNGGFKVDVDSIKRYGLRVMELSTHYAQPDDSKAQQKDYGQILKNFTGIVANWYYMNPAFLNGRMVCRFLPEARLGIPLKFYDTHIRPDNPYPKMELFYIQGVMDSYQMGAPLQTTLTLIRGLRYNLGDKKDNSALQQVATVRDRVKSFFNGLIG